MVVETWLHWYMVGFFVLFGILMLAIRRRFASAGSMVRVSCDEPYAPRLRAAVARRERLEALPSSVLAIAIAIASLGAAAIGLFVTGADTLLYAFVSLVLTFSLAAAYVKLRRSGGRRMASLRARRREAIVPPWLSAGVAVAAVSPLAFVDVAPVAAVLVTLAAVAIGVLGDAAARLPAILPGDDPAVDEYVDDRLRSVRAVNLTATACAPVYVFDAVTWVFATARAGFGAAGALHLAAMLFALVVLLAAVAWQIALVRRGPAAGDVERWGQLAG